MKNNTKIVNAGRSPRWTQGLVNPPVSRASTVVFDSVKQMKEATGKRHDKTLFYGRRGTQTSFAFQEAMTELEGGAGCAIYPCGTAAITASLQSFLQAGDHLLMVDTVYEPTRDFCDKMLSRMGVETTYYDPMIGEGIEQLIKPNTRVIFLESPGSLTMEVQDVPAITRVAKQHDIVVMLDNTWASPLYFNAFDYGVDISIQAATKYLVGHSDVMLGTATANERCWDQLRENSYLLGQCASPDDIYLAMRGIRTLGVRLAQHQQSALKVANWLAARDDVDHVRHPALASCPGHEFFERDFSGSCGLFSFVMKGGNQQALTAMLDGMHHFKMGYSWGGYESLILGVNGVDKLRSATKWQQTGSLIRVHIGLEDVDDLIADLDAGLARFNQHL
ncbi:cystathionine beta-lyase [Aliagarivorans marinus]|uniref:cystathionine beta-lyase n=1 Tax=Aliagarivorans marinus TaxID=561965 RepID=UPI0004110109|nr:cystathionine beta-lyase [Aliagarivorans marinus]